MPIKKHKDRRAYLGSEKKGNMKEWSLNSSFG